MITLQPFDSISAVAGTASAITYTLLGLEVGSSTKNYKVLAQGQLPIAAAPIYSAPMATQTLVKTVLLSNPTGSTVSGVAIFVNGTIAANQVASFSIVAGGFATFDQDGWKVYDAAGNYNRPPTTDFVPEGTTNLYFTTARAAAAAPVQSVNGASGLVSLNGGYVGVQGASIASASTVNLAAATGDFITITGTTAITALGTAAAGVHRTVQFSSALTLTHNATSLILLTAANINTVAGDISEFTSLGSGNWLQTAYSRASGAPLVSGSFTGGALTSALNEAPNVTLASASTVNIGAASANTINISGTTAITAFDTIAAGARRLLIFQGALTLTYNATSLILPGSANITTAAGDVAEFVSLGSGNWRCIDYQKANGNSVTPAAILASSNSFTNVQAVTPYRANISGAVSIDLAGVAKSNNLHLTLTGNVTSFTLTNGLDGAVYNIRFIQDATGGRSLSGLASNIKTGPTVVTLSTAANAVDLLSTEYGSTESTFEGSFRKGT